MILTGEGKEILKQLADLQRMIDKKVRPYRSGSLTIEEVSRDLKVTKKWVLQQILIGNLKAMRIATNPRPQDYRISINDFIDFKELLIVNSEEMEQCEENEERDFPIDIKKVIEDFQREKGLI